MVNLQEISLLNWSIQLICFVNYLKFYSKHKGILPSFPNLLGNSFRTIRQTQKHQFSFFEVYEGFYGITYLGAEKYN